MVLLNNISKVAKTIQSEVEEIKSRNFCSVVLESASHHQHICLAKVEVQVLLTLLSSLRDCSLFLEHKRACVEAFPVVPSMVIM